MLFANGYRYHMRSIGCPMSLDGYGLSNGYFGRYRHSIGAINPYDSYLNASSRRSVTPSCRRTRARIRRRTASERVQMQSSSAANVLAVLRSVFCNSNSADVGVSERGRSYLLPGVLPLVSRKCLISMTSALMLLLVLGIISTIVGGVYFQRGNHPSTFKDNIHQLLCIVAIICGIIMLLSSGVLCRVLFCKSKWNNTTSSPRHRVIVASNNSSHLNNGTIPNCNETVLNMSNDEDLFQNWSFQTQFGESTNHDEPPTYSECNASITDLPGQLESSTHITDGNSTTDSVTPPPKYSNEPPPRYSQLDVRTLMVSIVPNQESTQDDNVSFRDNAQESPLPALESISSPNNSLNEIETENILVIEDYKPC